jgi:type II secretory ATPase GspE/PulE/Tfp pilus assembly ATPase PilB-like protein
VSLYTCLNILNKPGINISTAEDPAEINLPGEPGQRQRKSRADFPWR